MHFTLNQILKNRSILLAVAVLMGLSFEVSAQLKIYPHPRQSGNSKQISKQRPSTARTKEIIPKSLPFWDDFSFTPVNDTTNPIANYPLDTLWVNNYTIWINDGIGIQPPSINIATFDGLDSAFLPYSEQVLTNGLRDSLVSQAIKLGEPEVTTGERNNVYLSFFYQWQGNGEAPDASDYLRVEFKNDLGAWETVLTIFPKPSFTRTEFYDTLIKVDGDRFFHNNFQFRFKNYGRQSGPYDTWNIDYVYLNKNRSVTDTDFPDQAISTTLTSLFNKYQSIPYDHFLNTNSVTPPKFDVSNNLDEFTDLTYITEGTFRNYKNGSFIDTFVSNLGVNDTSGINDNGSGIIFPLQKRTVTMQYPPDPTNTTQFDQDADSVRIKLKVKLFTGDTFDPKTNGYANDYDLNYIPIDFRANDTINAHYFLKDYYAYDDGIAEYAAGLTQAGNRGAVLFEMLTDAVDTLAGIDLYVPDYGLVSNLTVDFYVYKDQDGKPGDIIYSIPSFSIQRKGLNTFQRIQIIERFLVEGKFYIGWKAPVGGSLKIGLDVSNDSGDKIFVNTNGTWIQNTDVAGSLMIRPFFGSGEIINGIPGTEDAVSVFPNPSSGQFYVRGSFDSLNVITVTGQTVPYTMEEQGEDKKISLDGTASGLYILKIRKGATLQTEKIIVK